MLDWPGPHEASNTVFQKDARSILLGARAQVWRLTTEISFYLALYIFIF